MQREAFNPNLIAAPKDDGPAAAPGLLTVSQVTALVKHAIQSALPATVHVVGEISNFKRHAGGHLYLTLKDSSSELSCVMWRSDAGRLKFTPADGLEVIATGTVEVFERAGRYQLYIRKLEPRGVGALELAFRQLCERLKQEGLFDPARKRRLPAFPRRIVLVTSPTGAAVADMLRTIERRYPCVHVLVYPVRVQGPGAAAEIAAAIRAVNSGGTDLGGIDLMIVGRGGGSLEDLWAFNEETVARAIHASLVPIISAVGHEVDVTVADLVADVRAATPTAAAEIAVPELAEVMAGLTAQENRLNLAARGKTALASARLLATLQRRTLHQPLVVVHRREQLLDELAHRMQRSLSGRVHTVRRRLDSLEPVLQGIAPHSYLLRTTLALGAAEHRLHRVACNLLAVCDRRVAGIGRRLERASPAHRHARGRQQVENLARAIPAAMRHRLRLLDARVDSREDLLVAVSHESVLARGFSITRIKRGRRVVRSVGELKDGQRVLTQLADGEFESQTVNIRQLELFE